MKTNICVTIDMEVILEARKRKVNLSSLVNDFLKSYLKIKETKDKGIDINAAISTAKAKLLELEKKKDKIMSQGVKKVVIHNA